MTTYYVSPLYGNDSYSGLAANYSGAALGPWQTIGKVVNTGSPVVPGDTVYLAPGTYYAETLIPIASIASAASPTSIIGDTTNSQGFLDRSGVRLAPGVVLGATHTSSEVDHDPASTAIVLNMGTNDCQGLQFYNIRFNSGNGIGLQLDARRSASLLLQDCDLIGADWGMDMGQAPTAARNWTFRRCFIAGSRAAANFRPATAAATADADLNINFDDCLLIGGMLLNIGTTAGNKSGGVHLNWCTMITPGQAIGMNMTVSGGHSTAVVSDFTGCTFLFSESMAASADVGCIVDRGSNRSVSQRIVNSNVPQAATSQRNVLPHLVLPNLLKWGLRMDLNEIFGWTPDAASSIRFTGGTRTASDFRGRTVRPWGAGPSAGYLEAGNIYQDTSSQLTGGGATSLAIVGAGEVARWAQVDAVATTITILTKSTSYGGSSYPQVIMQANPAIGVAATTATATDATEQTLTLTFTPTAAGVVELRLISRSTSLSGQTNFDLLQVA